HRRHLRPPLQFQLRLRIPHQQSPCSRFLCRRRRHPPPRPPLTPLLLRLLLILLASPADGPSSDELPGNFAPGFVRVFVAGSVVSAALLALVVLA
ncbi:hypothetical protein LINPERPRIM_LOCUS21389, partial [Linum perenne]